jgi:L-ascorbate metabolism protein UlaG (beta-lactamase superfamily)
MAATLRFFGTAAYELVTADGVRVLIDPYLDSNPASPVAVADLARVDLVLVTHAAFDHMGDAAAILKRDRCPVICAKDVAHHLTTVQGVEPEQIRATIWGLPLEVAGVNVHPVESHHWSFSVTPSGELLSGPAMGFMVDAAPGVRVYHPGDSAITYDFRLFGELYQPTVGLMHVTLPESSMPHMEVYRAGELTVHEAVLASQWLGLKHVIPSHYQSASHPDVQRFVEIVGALADAGSWSPRVSVMQPGDVIELQP